MNVSGKVALVTGGQRGLGKAIAEELLARGASKVYVTARRPSPSSDPLVVPLALDVRDEAEVARLAILASDVSIVVNNAGVDLFADLLAGDIADIREEFEVNLFGLVSVSRAMAPVLARNGGGAFLNMLTALSWATVGDGYSASKAAAWSVSNGLRVLLAPAATSVTSVHLGYADTEMISHMDVPKVAPAEVATIALDGLERGWPEVLVDDITRQVRGMLSGDPTHLGISHG